MPESKIPYSDALIDHDVFRQDINLPSQLDLRIMEEVANDLVRYLPNEGLFKFFPMSLNEYFWKTKEDVDPESVSYDLSWVSDEFPTFVRECLVPAAAVFNVKSFKLFKYQRAFGKAIDQSRITAVFKSRQTGLSMTVIAYIIWRMLQGIKHGRKFTCVVYSITQADSRKLGERLIMMISKISHLIPPWKTNNRTKKQMYGGNVSVEFLASSSGRGTPATDLCVIDESDFNPDIETILQAIKPSLGVSGGKLVLITTPNGAGAPTYKTLRGIDPDTFDDVIEKVTQPTHTHNYVSLVKENSDDGGGRITGMLIHWRAHPHFDDAWMQNQIDSLGLTDQQRQVEYELSVTESGTRFFHHDYVESGAGYVEMREFDSIIAGVDIGFIKDYTACMVWGYFANTDSFYLIDYYYRNGATQVEDKAAVVRLCEEYEIDEVWIETNVGTDTFESLAGELAGFTRVEEWKTSEASKRTIMGTCRLLLEQGRLRYGEDSPFYQELPHFQEHQDLKTLRRKLGARLGYHDDAIIASAIALYQLQKGPVTWVSEI